MVHTLDLATFSVTLDRVGTPSARVLHEKRDAREVPLRVPMPQYLAQKHETRGYSRLRHLLLLCTYVHAAGKKKSCVVRLAVALSNIATFVLTPCCAAGMESAQRRCLKALKTDQFGKLQSPAKADCVGSCRGRQRKGAQNATYFANGE